MAENTITFKLIPNMNKPLIRESRVRLRALFDYDPVGDKYIPCKEAGLSFHKGDILHIVSQDDPYWYESILSKVLYICVSFWLLAHESRDLSETKIIVVTS